MTTYCDLVEAAAFCTTVMPRFVPPLAASVQNPPPVVADRGRVIVLRVLPKAWKKRLQGDCSDELQDTFADSCALRFGASLGAVLRATTLRGDALLENIDNDPLLFFGMLKVCYSAATADDVERHWRRLLTSNELIPKGRVGLAIETSHRISAADDVARIAAAVEKAERAHGIKFEDAFEPVKFTCGPEQRHTPKPRPRGRANKKRKLGAD